MRNLLLVCAYARAWEEGNSYFFTIQNTTLSAAQFALRELVSWCFEVFLKNDPSFYEKWRVVLWEKTCCFMKSDVLFMQDNILVVQFYDFALLRVWALFFIRSRRSPLCQRLTTKHLLNNRIKSVLDLMSERGYICGDCNNLWRLGETKKAPTPRWSRC